MYSATAHSVPRILVAFILLTLAATAATTTAFAGASGIMFGFSDDPDPGNARPDESPYSMSNTDTVTHTGAVGDGFWINVHNTERQLIDTKILTIMFRGEGREKIKPVKVVGYDAAGTEGDTAEEEDIEGDHGESIAIYTCELSPQPDYEKIEFEFIEAGTVNIVIRVNSFCGEFEGTGNIYHMDNVSYGKEGYMYGIPALTELYIFPTTQSIGTTAPPVLVAPPGSGVWWHELVYADPEGNPREQGGIRWYTSGAGIAVGEFFDLAITLDGPADDRYTFYSYDAEVQEYSRFVMGEVPTTGIGEPVGVPGSNRARLLSASPNPFSRATEITLGIDSADNASLSVYSVDGRLIRTLARGVAASGDRQVTWDGRLDNGLQASTGIYFISLSAGNERRTVKVMKE